MDDNNNKTLEDYEFAKAIKDFRVSIADNDIRRLFRYMDADGSGSIDYEELIHRVRGELNDFRIGLVRQAFRKLDKTGDGVVNLDDIRGVYNAQKHPDVVAGKKTEDEVLCEFLDTFE